MTTHIPPAECLLGYPKEQVEAIVTKNGRDPEEFWEWMRGQTVGVCDGARWNPESKSNEPTDCGPHGAAVYGHDLRRFLNGLPVID